MALMLFGWASIGLALDVQITGDLDNRFVYSTQADTVRYGVLSYEGWVRDYVNVDQVRMLLADSEEKDKDGDFFAEVKYRLSFNATSESKKVTGVVGFEFGAIKYGQEPSLAVGDTGGTVNTTGMDFAGDDNNFELMHAFLDFEVPFDTASRLRMGLQPAVYNNFVWIDNAAGIKYTSTRGKLSYSLGWWRDNVSNSGLGGDARDNDDDVFAVDATYTFMPGTKLNAFALYYRDDNERLYTNQLIPSAVTPTSDDTKIWLGVAGSGSVGNLYYGGTLIYLTGEIDPDGGETINGHDKLDRSAFLANAEATYNLGKTRIRGGWLYSTGDDDSSDGDANNFATIDPYMGWYGSAVIFDSLANDNSAVVSPFIQDKGLNMPYLTVDHGLTADLSVGASYLYIMAAEDFDGNDPDSDKNNDIGHELSVRASYTIDKGLTANWKAGYLVGGDGWDELASSGEGDNVFRTDFSVRYRF